jgi:prevent-host-death family protein
MDRTVTVRRLQRETPAVLREVESGGASVIVTRGGEEVARIVPLSPTERLWRRWVRDMGGDPDDPRYRRNPDAVPAATRPGGTLSEALAELRDAER